MDNFPIRGTVVYLMLLVSFIVWMISDGMTGTGILFTAVFTLPIWILLSVLDEDVTETN